MFPINGKRNVMENEKPTPYGLRLACSQSPKELKEERETSSLRFKTCFQTMAKRNVKEKGKPIPYGLRLATIQRRKEVKKE